MGTTRNDNVNEIWGTRFSNPNFSRPSHCVHYRKIRLAVYDVWVHTPRHNNIFRWRYYTIITRLSAD